MLYKPRVIEPRPAVDEYINRLFVARSARSIAAGRRMRDDYQRCELPEFRRSFDVASLESDK